MSDSSKTIRLYNTQMDFVRCDDRFTAFIGGIGSGKTFAGAARTLKYASTPDTLGVIVAPTYPMLRDATLRTVMDMFDGLVGTFYRSDMILELKNGSEILFRSADDPNRLRGPNLNWAWLDEAALCDSDTWQIIIGRLRADGKAGPCWVTTTPKGRNWLYERQNLMTIFRAKTRDNPYLDDDFVTSLEIAYTGNFALQELNGDFVTFEGLVYEEFDRARHVVPTTESYPRYIAGIDEGYTNPAVILTIGVDNDGRAHVVEEFYRRRILRNDLVTEMRRLNDKYHYEMILVDPSAAGLIAELVNAHLPVQAADNTVSDGIQRVKSRLVVAPDGLPRLTLSPSCVNTMAEVESYAWKNTKTGISDEPDKINDHAMDALRYAIAYIDRGATRMRVSHNLFYN